MISISRASQFISPGQDYQLSSLPASEKSRIISIRGEAVSGGLASWTPSTFFPSLAILKANRVYLIQSSITQVGSLRSFTPYTLSATDGGLHPQNNAINKIFQFFTYRGPGNFDLNALDPAVKSKITRVYAQGATSTGNFRIWTPSLTFSPLRFLVPGFSYLIENEDRNFVAYDLGVPVSESSSSSSADEMPLTFINDFLLPEAGLSP